MVIRANKTRYIQLREIHQS